MKAHARALTQAAFALVIGVVIVLDVDVRQDTGDWLPNFLHPAKGVTTGGQTPLGYYVPDTNGPRTSSKAPFRGPAGATSGLNRFESQLKGLRPELAASAWSLVRLRYVAIANALPMIDGGEPSPFESAKGWADWVGTQEPEGVDEAEEIVQLLQTPIVLPDGTPIEQRFDPTLGLVTSSATCMTNGTRPVISYDPKALAATTTANVRFIRAHEIGHFASGHISCGPMHWKTNYVEREADCWAVASLHAEHTPGDLSIGAAAEFFRHRLDLADDHYESALMRSHYIEHLCS